MVGGPLRARSPLETRPVALLRRVPRRHIHQRVIRTRAGALGRGASRWRARNGRRRHSRLPRTVEDLQLSVRSKRALIKLGVRTLAELAAKTEAELLGCKNFGVTSLNEIKERMAVYGVSLRTLD